MNKAALTGILVRVLVLLPVSLCLLPLPTPACSLCTSLYTKQTLRTEMNQAKIVAYGNLANDKIIPGTGKGSTDLQVLKVLKSNPALGNQQVIQINSYIPILDKKNPPQFVVFAHVEDGKVVVFTGRSVESPAMLGYLGEITKLGEPTAMQRLSFYFKYLDHADSEIATDAFLEFAKTSDKDLADIAPKFDSEKFRKLLLDPKTGSEKIGLLAFLLAAGKNPKDSDLLRGLVEKPTAKTQAALDGVLCGLIQLQPDEGWKTVYSILGNKKKTFNDRYAAFRVVRFYYNWKPKEYQPQIMYGLNVMLGTDMADLAMDSLRRWGVWDLTPAVLNLYGKAGYTAPIMERAIVRYALCCPLPQAKTFVAEVRKTRPALVKELEQDLEFDKQTSQANP